MMSRPSLSLAEHGKQVSQQRVGNVEDQGYTLVKAHLISEPSTLEAMIKFYTRDLKHFQDLGKSIPAILLENIKLVKERITELGHKPEELLNRPNESLETKLDHYKLAEEVKAKVAEVVELKKLFNLPSAEKP
jgi:hypothetical protein